MDKCLAPKQNISIVETNTVNPDKEKADVLKNYNIDKNTEDLKNEIGLEDNRSVYDKFNLEEELDLDDIDLDYKYQNVDENGFDRDADSDQKIFHLLEDSFRRYNAIYESCNY